MGTVYLIPKAKTICRTRQLKGRKIRTFFRGTLSRFKIIDHLKGRRHALLHALLQPFARMMAGCKADEIIFCNLTG